MLQDCFYRPALTSIFVLGMCLPSTSVLTYTCVCSGNVSLRVFLTWSWRSQHPSVPCSNRCHKEKQQQQMARIVFITEAAATNATRITGFNNNPEITRYNKSRQPFGGHILKILPPVISPFRLRPMGVSGRSGGGEKRERSWRRE